MIKFFRPIRQRLLQDPPARSRPAGHRFSRYLLYAIGEIVLVVIGILIALQINNWNTNRIQSNKERTYLKNIKRDLKEQLLKIDDQIKFENTVIASARPIIQHYKETQKFKVDSTFTASIGLMTGRMTFVKIDPTYSELLASGNVDIISNEDIKNKLVIFFKGLERLEQVINKNNNLFTDDHFLKETLSLSEIQIAADYMMDAISSKAYNKDIPDLNESRLKDITKLQLEKPENELLMINLINFRNYVSVVHIDFMKDQKEKTEALIKDLDNL